jgi:hypothetical protein
LVEPTDLRNDQAPQKSFGSRLTAAGRFRCRSDMAQEPINPLSYTAAGRKLAASAKIFERLTRRNAKPAFDLTTTAVDGKIVPNHRAGGLGAAVLQASPF